MKRLGSVLLLLGLSIVVACARPDVPSLSPGTDEAPSLRYGFGPGTRYAIRTAVDVTASARASDAEIAETLEATGETRQSLSLDLTQSFDPGDDGILEMSTVIDDVRLEARVGGEPRPLPPEVLAGLRGMRIDATIDRQGRVGTETLTGAHPDGVDLDALSGLGASMPTLPERALAVGDSFTSETEAGLPVPGGTVARVSVSLRYTLRAIRDGRAIFDVATVLGAAEADGPVSVAGEGDGRAIFDLRDGYFAETTLAQAMTLGLVGPPSLTLNVRLDLSTSTAPLP